MNNKRIKLIAITIAIAMAWPHPLEGTWRDRPRPYEEAGRGGPRLSGHGRGRQYVMWAGEVYVLRQKAYIERDKKQERKHLLELRIRDFEDYPAPLSEKGKPIIQRARQVLEDRGTTLEQVNEALAILDNPELDWFEPLFKEFGEYEKGLFRHTLFFNFTWGCPTQCAFCFSNAPRHITSMPWAWVVELKSRLGEIGRTAESSPLWSDPLRSYYDRVFRRDYGDVAILHNLTGAICTSGFAPNSLGERAARKIIGHFSSQGRKIEVDININAVNDWIRAIGRDKYVEYIKHVADVFGKGNTKYTTFGNVSKKDRIDAVSVLREIMGDQHVGQAGGVYAGKIVHLDVTEYTYFTENFHRPLFSGTHLMPNGDMVKGPFDTGATEYKCLRQYPGSRPLGNVNYVVKPTPIIEYTDQSPFHLVWFNDVYDYYDKKDMLLYDTVIGRLGKPPKALLKMQDIGDFWEKYLKRFIEEAHNPSLRDLKPEQFRYAMLLSTIDANELEARYNSFYIELVLKKDPKKVKRDEIAGPDRQASHFTFGNLIRGVVKDYEAAPAEEKGKYECFLLICQEWIYRHWDISERPLSYRLFRPNLDDPQAALHATAIARVAEKYKSYKTAARLWNAAAYFYSRAMYIGEAYTCQYLSARNWFEAGKRMSRQEYSEEALECIKRSLQISEEIGDRGGVALCLFEASKRCLRNYYYDEAAAYAESAAICFSELRQEQLKVGPLEIIAWTNAATGNHYLKNYAKAGYCSRTAAELYAGMDVEDGKDRAIQHYLKAAASFDEAGMQEGAADCRVKADETCQGLIRDIITRRESKARTPRGMFAFLGRNHRSIVKAYAMQKRVNELTDIIERTLSKQEGTSGAFSKPNSDLPLSQI